MKYTANQFEEITRLCRNILSTAERVVQKCGESPRKAFGEAFWELDKVHHTCLILGYHEGCEVALHYREAAWTQEHKGDKDLCARVLNI